MATNTAPSTKSAPNNSNTKPVVEPPKPVDNKPDVDTQPTEPVQAEPQAAQAASTPQASGNAEKVIISLSVSPKLAKQVRLLSKLEGVSISAIFLNAVASDIPSRLRVALATIVED